MSETNAAGPSGGPVIRLAHADELDALRAIERSAAARFREVGLAHVAELPPLPRTTLEVGRLNGLLFVAERDGAPIGFLLASIMDAALHVEELDVDPAHQRRGVGRALVERACDEARARGLAAVTLITFRDVPWNEPFYASAGFVALHRAALGPSLAAKVDEDATRLGSERRVAMRRMVGRSANGHPR